jgi:hypothetical protein
MVAALAGGRKVMAAISNGQPEKGSANNCLEDSMSGRAQDMCSSRRLCPSRHQRWRNVQVNVVDLQLASLARLNQSRVCRNQPRS